MDNNNPIQNPNFPDPLQAGIPNPTVPPTPAPGSPVIPSQPGQNNNSKTFLAVGAFALIILIIIGTFVFLASRKVNDQKAALTKQEEQLTSLAKDLENELNLLDLGDIEADLAEVDTDLKGL